MGNVLIQQIMLIAGFAITAILAVTWVGSALLNKEADTSSCIESASTYDNTHSCNGSYHVDNHSYKKDSGYSSRY